MKFLKYAFILIFVCTLSVDVPMPIVHGQTNALDHINLKQNVQLQVGSNQVKGAILDSQIDRTTAYTLVIKSKQEQLLKKVIILNQSFTATLVES